LGVWCAGQGRAVGVAGVERGCSAATTHTRAHHHYTHTHLPPWRHAAGLAARHWGTPRQCVTGSPGRVRAATRAPSTRSARAGRRRPAAPPAPAASARACVVGGGGALQSVRCEPRARSCHAHAQPALAGTLPGGRQRARVSAAPPALLLLLLLLPLTARGMWVWKYAASVSLSRPVKPTSWRRVRACVVWSGGGGGGVGGVWGGGGGGPELRALTRTPRTRTRWFAQTLPHTHTRTHAHPLTHARTPHTHTHTHAHTHQVVCKHDVHRGVGGCRCTW
jgi:hypothetical protein